jgi:hypothetical protein
VGDIGRPPVFILNVHPEKSNQSGRHLLRLRLN